MFDLRRVSGRGEKGDKKENGSHGKPSTAEVIGKGSRIEPDGREEVLRSRASRHVNMRWAGCVSLRFLPKRGQGRF